MSKKNIQYCSIKLPKVLNIARGLSSKGSTQLTKNNLFYLNVDDAYIHELFPLLNDDRVQKPDYFAEKSSGAHITIIYPEENKNISEDDLQLEHDFFVKDIVSTEIEGKTYYALLIGSPSLKKLRKKYSLPPLLSFKDFSVEFHITIGVKIFKVD